MSIRSSREPSEARVIIDDQHVERHRPIVAQVVCERSRKDHRIRVVAVTRKVEQAVHDRYGLDQKGLERTPLFRHGVANNDRGLGGDQADQSIADVENEFQLF